MRSTHRLRAFLFSHKLLYPEQSLGRFISAGPPSHKQPIQTPAKALEKIGPHVKVWMVDDKAAHEHTIDDNVSSNICVERALPFFISLSFIPIVQFFTINVVLRFKYNNTIRQKCLIASLPFNFPLRDSLRNNTKF